MSAKVFYYPTVSSHLLTLTPKVIVVFLDEFECFYYTFRCSNSVINTEIKGSYGI